MESFTTITNQYVRNSAHQLANSALPNAPVLPYVEPRRRVRRVPVPGQRRFHHQGRLDRGRRQRTPFTFLVGVFGKNWTAKTEYLYVDLGTSTGGFDIPVLADLLGVDASLGTARSARVYLPHRPELPLQLPGGCEVPIAAISRRQNPGLAAGARLIAQAARTILEFCRARR